mmetsp:Transcript_27776/g.50156  ORF Transcript_27776/g.50156 Transcript_27776/m.50156 type:complete len:286 (-) Transcript_27776:51-908(-)
MMESTDVNFNPDFSSCSVESLLNVPMQFIFRETKTGDRGRRGNARGNQKNFIFSKSEVSTLLRVSMLSSELDAILSLVSDALDRSQKCKTYSKYIEQSNKESASSNAKGILLRALLPILNVHSDTAELALNHATCETFGISRILNELEECANDLGKFGEQNHNMADQLDCYNMAPGQQNILSNEKRAIAEIEEAIVERIQNLNVLAMGSSLEETRDNEDSPTINAFDGANAFTSMSDLCEILFTKHHLSTNIGPPHRPVAKGQFSESQMNAAEALSCMQLDSRGK